MGVSTNGMIGFGILLGELELPWDVDRDGCIDSWWRQVNGFEDVHEPWTDTGHYAQGWSTDDPRFEEYWEARRDWDKRNLRPADFENCCSGDCPIWVATVPGSVQSCSRGYPEAFDPEELHVPVHSVSAMLRFLDKYEIEYEGQPSWLLMSYWG